MLVWFGFASPDKPPFNPQDCWSLDIHRVQVEDVIFDLPPGVHVSNMNEVHKQSLISIPHKIRPAGRHTCQKTGSAPFKFDEPIRLWIPEGPHGLPEIAALGEMKSIPLNQSIVDFEDLNKCSEHSENEIDGALILRIICGDKEIKINCLKAGCDFVYVSKGNIFIMARPRKFYVNSNDKSKKIRFKKYKLIEMISNLNETVNFIIRYSNRGAKQ